MQEVILYKNGKYIVGVTTEGQIFESYATLDIKNILGASALYIKELQKEIEVLKEQLGKKEQ